jgi:DNA gyrase subunit B
MSKKEIKSLIYINNDSSGSVRRKSVVSKLFECTSRSSEGTELWITEGDSAAGSIVSARDKMTQAVLPIRGKILNVSKLREISSCMKNEEVRSIVNAIGAGIFEDIDVSKSRYSMVIAGTDADADGGQIATLISALFINVLPALVKAGMLYLSQPPLYGWEIRGKYYFTNEIKDIPSGIDFHRYKGLGEMDPVELKYSILDPDHRELVQVQYPEDLQRFNEILTSSKAKYDLLYNLGIVKYHQWRASSI